MEINPSIFKAYDVRGIYPGELNEKAAGRIGEEVAKYIFARTRKKKVSIVLARDVRTSSPSLSHYVKEGLLHAGADVIDAGLMTTPMIYFVLDRLKADGGIMITASHNPAEYNGFKIFGPKISGISIGLGLEKIRDKVIGAPDTIVPGERGTYREVSLIDEYVSFLAGKVKIGSNPVRVAIDAAGGSAALILPQLLHALGINYTPLFFDIDGDFSRHSPNPMDRRAQAHIKKELASGEYQMGVMFDGDADRAIFFDEQGEEVRPDFVLALLAEDALKRTKKGTFIVELSSSKAVREYITTRGGKPVLCRVGRTYMHEAMLKHKAIAGGEVSGHFLFKDFFYWDSALLAFLKVFELVSSRSVSFSSLARPLAAYVSSGQVSIEVESKELVTKAVESYYAGQGIHSNLDGITVEFDNWWFNIRPSNTESMVRYMIEADSEKTLTEKSAELEKIIERGQ